MIPIVRMGLAIPPPAQPHEALLDNPLINKLWLSESLPVGVFQSFAAENKLTPMTDNLQILLRERPNGKLTPEHFESRNVTRPTPNEGEVLIRSVLLSLDAANRAWLQGATYKAAVNPGDVMHGLAIGEVVESRSSDFKAGDLVLAELGWQEWGVLPARALRRCTDHRPLSQQLSLTGVAGLTAYHGLMSVSGIRDGETLLVSAAAGSVGSIVGQIGKLQGARVVGIAGGKEKCAWVVDSLGFDACIDYKGEDVSAALKTHCPKGVDVYFDNVGGVILQAALFAMRNHGRIACCGAVSQYDSATPKSPAGIPGLLVVKRVRMEGFIVMDYYDKNEAALRDLTAWSKSGKLKVAEDIIPGLAAAPAALVGLLAGENRGKRMIRVSADPS
jgi:NADPH-dependent curcumin reductase CurA